MINYIKAAWRLGWFQVPGWLSFLALQQLALVNLLEWATPQDPDIILGAVFSNFLMFIVEFLLWVECRSWAHRQLTALTQTARLIEYEQAKIEAQQGQLTHHDRAGDE